MTPEIRFRSWEGRPALLATAPGSGFRAVSILEPGSDWVKVDGLDVARSADAAGSTAEEFSARFAKSFGSIDPSAGISLVTSMLSRALAAE